MIPNVNALPVLTLVLAITKWIYCLVFTTMISWWCSAAIFADILLLGTHRQRPWPSFSPNSLFLISILGLNAFGGCRLLDPLGLWTLPSRPSVAEEGAFCLREAESSIFKSFDICSQFHPRRTQITWTRIFIIFIFRITIALIHSLVWFKTSQV